MSRANRAEIQRQLAALDRQARRRALRDGLVRGCQRVAAQIEATAPRATGKLAGSVRVRAGAATKRHLTATVVVGDPQGPPVAFWQEFGTAHMPAHPFVRPAVLDQTPHVVGDVENALRAAVR